MDSVERLIQDVLSARVELLEALDAVAPESMTTPGLVGEWSGRELIAHVGYWVGHAVEAVHAVEQGRADDVGQDEPPVDEVNATVARVARETDLATVRKREAASIGALLDRLRLIDPQALAARLPDGATLEESVIEDAAAHYREHAAEVRRILQGRVS